MRLIGGGAQEASRTICPGPGDSLHRHGAARPRHGQVPLDSKLGRALRQLEDDDDDDDDEDE